MHRVIIRDPEKEVKKTISVSGISLHSLASIQCENSDILNTCFYVLWLNNETYT
jgi:hypothetical protein